MAGFFTAPRFAWGPGAVEQLSGIEVARALVAVDPAVARADGHRRVVEELAKTDAAVEVVVLDAAPDHEAAVRALAERLGQIGADTLVAVGGGRAIDAAKGARLLAARPTTTLGALPPVLELAEPGPVRLIAVPTTSGSGAEASGTADLWDAAGRPVEPTHRALAPAWALVDAAMARGLPTERIVDGALESAALAIEAYVSAWTNPFSDALARDAATTVVRRLPSALRWADDAGARADLHYAASRAGLAVANAQRGLAHALARALEPATDLPYGRLLGIALPFVLEFDHPSARERLEELARTVAVPDETGRIAVVPWPLKLRRLYDLVRFPADLAAAGVPRARVDDGLPRIVERTLGSPAVLANPRVPSAADVAAIVRAMAGPGAD
jgi:alcohol dehydrogenase class IV